MGSALRGGVGRWAASMREWPVFELARWLQIYVFAVIAADVVAIAVSVPFAALRGAEAELFIVLLGCDVATVELTRRAGEPAGLIKEIHAVWELPIALLLPPFYALLAPIVRITLTQWRVRRALLYRRVFTAAALGLSYGTASVVFHRLTPLLTGPDVVPGPRIEVWTLAVIGCGVLRSGVNKVLVMTAVKGADPATSVKAELFNREALFGDLAELSVGVLVAVAAVAASAWMALCALPCVVLLQRSQRHSQLLSASRIDDRTGLLNAVTWQREAAVIVARASRSGDGLMAVAIADIDHFKKVNDTFGHPTGDVVLATVALAMKGVLRETDLCGRYGIGDEFAFLLPDAGPNDATDIAQRLCDAVAQITFADPDDYGVGEPLQVTVSVGVAALDRPHGDVDELIRAADAALYRAKAEGRGRICLVTD